MLIAAVAVSSGIAPEVPLLRALLNSVVQLAEVDEFELMQADRMLARVSILVRGTLLEARVELANPVTVLARSAALAMPVTPPGLEAMTWVASVATPAIA